MAYVSRDWIALEKGLVLFGLLGDLEHSSRVPCQVPNRWVARDGAQPGGVFRWGGREGIGRAHQNVETKLCVTQKGTAPCWGSNVARP